MGAHEPAKSLHVASWALAPSLSGTKGQLQGLLRHEPQALSRSACLLCRLPNNNCPLQRQPGGGKAPAWLLSPRAPAALAEPVYWRFFL